MAKYYIRDYSFYATHESNAEIQLSITAVRDNSFGSAIDYDFVKKIEDFLLDLNNGKKDKTIVENIDVPEETISYKKITSAFDDLEP